MEMKLASKYAFFIGSTAVLGFAIIKLWLILVPFLVAYILNFALKPAVNFLEQRSLGHTVSVVVVFITSFVILSLFLWLMIPALFSELSNIQQNLPMYQASLMGKINGLENFLFGSFGGMLSNFSPQDGAEDMKTAISSFSSGLFLSVARKIPSLVVSFLPLFMYIVIIPFATFFLLMDEYRIKKAFLGMVPNRYFEVSLNLIHSLNQQFGWLLGGMLITAVIMSVVISFLLWLIGLEYPILLGTFSGLANLIPYAGPIVGSFAAFFIALITGSPNMAYLYIIFVFALANLIENVLIQPIILARAANLHPLTVIFLIMVGSKFGGILGMLVAVPPARLIQVAIRIVIHELKRPVRPPFSSYRDIDISGT